MSDPGSAADGHRAAERAARLSYGRLLAYLARHSRDVAGAEDALADALCTAIETWPRAGIPRDPQAWLLAVARRRLVDAARHDRVVGAASETLRVIAPAGSAAAAARALPDERLGLLFACSHPAIEEAARTPLMLQTVLGFDATRIASAFVVAPATMGQRLVRAKARIRDAGIAFEVPAADELAARLDAVLSAIYAAYGSGWDDVGGSEPRSDDLAEEAIWLGRLVCALLPEEPEAAGLLALMLHCEARRPARRDAGGNYVPLDRQGTKTWSTALIAEAEQHLGAAVLRRRPGRFQLEAAIQSVHARRAVTGRTDWEAIALLYEGLMEYAPSIGAQVGRAAALAEARSAECGLGALDAVPETAVKAYQPYWALRADLLQRLNRLAAAKSAYSRAIGLSTDGAVRRFLSERSAALKS